MKTVQKTLLMLSLVCLALAGFAQISYGIRGGVHYGNAQIPSIANAMNFNATATPGADLGFFAEIPLNENFSFRPELNYISKGFRVAEGLNFTIANLPIPLGLEAVTRIRYVQIPILGKYSFGTDGVRPYLVGGPAVGYASSAKLVTRVNSVVDFNVGSTDIDLSKSTYDRLEVNAIGGLGIGFPVASGEWFVEGRYSYGLTDLLDDPIVDLKLRNKGWGLSAGYKMNF